MSSSVPGGVVTVRNGSYYTSSSITVSVAGPNAGDFTAPSYTCSVPPVTTPNYCSVPVTFTPSATGTRNARMMFDSAEYVRATGVGNPAGPSVTTTFLDSTYSQGSAYIDQYGNASVTDRYTLVNNGSTTLNLRFTSVGSFAADFVPTGNCTTLAPQATCILSVAFNALAATPGNYSNSVTIADTSSTYTRALADPVTVFFPQLNATTPLSFATTAVGSTSSSLPLQVTNGNVSGNVPLGHAVSISAPSTANFTVTGPTTCPASTTQICTFTLVFTPTTSGSLSDHVTLTDAVSGKTAVSTLTGTGGSPAVSLSARTFTFPSRSVGSTSTPMSSVLTNTGTVSLNVSAVNLVGTTGGNFTQTNNCATVPVNGTCTVSISFSPVAAGTQNATVQIVSNAPSTPDTIAVSGSAQ